VGAGAAIDAGAWVFCGSEANESRGWHHVSSPGTAAVQFDSHEKSLARGKTEIQLLVSQLNIRPRDDMTEAAHRLYRLALQRNFTRGRRTNQVESADTRLLR
jgi:transcription factor IIIB 90 kDa subunit